MRKSIYALGLASLLIGCSEKNKSSNYITLDYQGVKDGAELQVYHDFQDTNKNRISLIRIEENPKGVFTNRLEFKPTDREYAFLQDLFEKLKK